MLSSSRQGFYGVFLYHAIDCMTSSGSFSERESPVQTWAVIDLKPFAKLFNASMTYSRKSDIAQPHGMCSEKLPNRSKSEDILPDIASKKTELAAWFVSHCSTRSRREEYVKELTRHIPVHVYGKCGQYNCSKDDSKECDQLLKRKYKFYLAFENSLCEGYMTEKFWKCFELDIIPVVYGLGPYGLYAPSHSFIDVRDFASPNIWLTIYYFLIRITLCIMSILLGNLHTNVEEITLMSPVNCVQCCMRGDMQNKAILRWMWLKSGVLNHNAKILKLLERNAIVGPDKINS